MAQETRITLEHCIAEVNMKTETKVERSLNSDVLKAIDFSTESMFMGRKMLVIEHRGEPYYLRVTRNDKLILTK